MLLAGAPVVGLGAYWYRLWRREHLEIALLREKVDSVFYALDSTVTPSLHEIQVLKQQVRELAHELGRHEARPHMPLSPVEARRAAREARQRQRDIEEALNG